MARPVIVGLIPCDVGDKNDEVGTRVCKTPEVFCPRIPVVSAVNLSPLRKAQLKSPAVPAPQISTNFISNTEQPGEAKYHVKRTDRNDLVEGFDGESVK